MRDSVEIPLSREEAITLLDYSPTSGEFRWKPRSIPNWDGRFANKVAGTELYQKDGRRQGIRIQIRIKGKLTMIPAHRLAWLIMTGDQPPAVVDHENGNPFDNRWLNLRDGSKGVNDKNKRKYINNTSGVTGVRYCKSLGKWMAREGKAGKNYLGLFPTRSEAEEAAVNHRKSLNYTDRHGRSNE